MDLTHKMYPMDGPEGPRPTQIRPPSRSNPKHIAPALRRGSAAKVEDLKRLLRVDSVMYG